jgi:hypothetical protein
MDEAPALRKGGTKTKRRASEMSLVSCPNWTCGMATQTAWQGSNADEDFQHEDYDDYYDYYDGSVSHGCKRQDRGMTPAWGDLVAFADRRTRGTVRTVTDELGSLWMDSTVDDMLIGSMLLSVG